MLKDFSPATALQSVTFTPQQVVDLTGVTHRELRYWGDMGYLGEMTTRGDREIRRFTYDQVRFACLLKQARDSGLAMREALDAVQDFLVHSEETVVRAPAPPPPPAPTKTDTTTIISTLMRFHDEVQAKCKGFVPDALSQKRVMLEIRLAYQRFLRELS